jgi:hypothetical protein
VIWPTCKYGVIDGITDATAMHQPGHDQGFAWLAIGRNATIAATEQPSIGLARRL